MVSFESVRASNLRIASSLPAGLVAVFVGATSGIGETTLKQFAKYAREPRVYFIGRSKEAGQRIAQECTQINPSGQFNFISADVSLLRNVDDVCHQIAQRESIINLLVLSQGAIHFGEVTSENLLMFLSLINYSRARFVVNFLPNIRRAQALRRVVYVAGGTKEGPIDHNDLTGQRAVSLSELYRARGHLTSMITLNLESMARLAPTVSFVHSYPGTVKTGFHRGAGWLLALQRTILAILGPWLTIPLIECGERHVYLATSARYPSKEAGAVAVPLDVDMDVAEGADGKIASGVYSVNEHGESAGSEVVRLLHQYREDETREALWKDVEEQFQRITGKTRMDD